MCFPVYTCKRNRAEKHLQTIENNLCHQVAEGVVKSESGCGASGTTAKAKREQLHDALLMSGSWVAENMAV